MSLTHDLKSQILEYIKQSIPQNVDMPIVERSVPVPFLFIIDVFEFSTIFIILSIL